MASMAEYLLLRSISSAESDHWFPVTWKTVASVAEFAKDPEHPDRWSRWGPVDICQTQNGSRATSGYEKPRGEGRRDLMIEQTGTVQETVREQSPLTETLLTLILL